MALFVRDKSFYRTLAALALPIAFKNVITLSVNLADNVMASSLGKDALGGIYIATQIFTLLQNLTDGMCTALTVLATQYWGKRDTDSIKRLCAIVMRAGLVLAALAWLAGFCIPRQVLGLYTDDILVIEQGIPYLQILSFSFLCFCVTEVLVAAMRCVEQVRIGLWVSLVTLVVNVSLNYVLIFGKLGFPALGVRGAAIATLVSRICELMVMLVYTRRIDQKLLLRFRDFLTRSAPLAKDLAKYGLPILGGSLVWGLNMNVQSAIIGHLGSSAISAVSVANTVFALLSVVVFGVSAAASVIIGKTVGEGQIELVKSYARTLQMLFLGLGLVTGAAIYLSRGPVMRIYGSLDPETLRLTRQFLTVLSVTTVGTAYQACSLTGIVRAGGATSFVFINDTIWVWCVVIPSALIAAFVLHAEPWIVFSCLKCDQILKCSVAVVKVNRFRWIKQLTRETTSAGE